MPTMKRVLGLDVGSHALKAVEIRQTFRGLEPVQFRVQPRGLGDSDLEAELREFIATHQLPTEHVVCAVASDRLTLHQLKLPFRNRKQLKQTVPFQVEGQIPFDLEDVVIDWQTIGGDASEVRVAAALAQRRDIAQLLHTLRAAECEPRILEAEGLAFGNLAGVFDLSGRRLLVDIGHAKTTLCLLVDGQAVATRSFRVAGRQVDEAISKDLGWNLDEAARWKCEEGIFNADLSSRSPEALAVLDRIAREIVRTLESHERLLGGAAESQLDGITLVGGGARLHRIDEYLTGRTGVVCSRLGLPADSEDAALVAGGEPLLFAGALSLALRATMRSKTRLNFRKDEFAYRTDFSRYLGKDLRPTAILAGVVLLLVLTGFVTSSLLDSGRGSRLEDRVAEIYGSAFPDTPMPEDPLAAMRTAVADAQDRADFLGVYGSDRSALDLLTELSRRIPADLDVEFDEVTIDPRVIRMKVSGRRFEDPDRVIAALRSEPPFEQARVTGETKKVKDRIVFNVTVPLVSGDDAA